MEKYLILAKKLISKFKKSRKYRLFLLVFVVKIVLSLIGLLFVGYLAIAANQADAAYGLSADIRQVKTADNPTVYYLDHSRGMKKAYVSAKAFLSYGNSWSDIKIIGQEDLNKWPDVRLVKSTNNPAVYYLENGTKALIKSAQQFADSGFKWEDIVTIGQADLDEYKTIEFKVAGAAVETGDTLVTITVDPESPAQDFLAVNTLDNLVGIFDLKTDNSLVEIKNLTLDINGLYYQSIINDVYITDGNGAVYDVPHNIYHRKVIFNFNNKPLTVRAGETRKIKVYLDLNNASTIDGTLQVSINYAANIVGARAVGSFPLACSTFSLTAAGNYLGQVTAAENSLNIPNNETAIGSTEEIVGKFTITETSKMSDVFLKEIALINAGSASSEDLSDFKLKNKINSTVAAASEMTKDGEVIFRFNDYKISKGTSDTFTVFADINSGDSRTVNLQLDKVKIKSSRANYNLSAGITNIDENITIKRKTISIISKDLKSSKNIFNEQTGVIIGVFEIRNNKQEISIERLNLTLEKSANAPSFSQPVYLVNYQTGEVYAYFSGSDFDKGAVSINLNGLELAAKNNLTLTLLTDIEQNVKNGDSYKIVVNSVDYRTASGRFTDNVNAQGVKLVVNKSVIYLYPNNDLGELKYTKGEKKVKIASFILESASGSDTKVTGLTIALGDSSGAITFANGFSNVKAYVGSSLAGTIKEPNSSNLTFGNFKYTLKGGKQTEVKIYADIDRDLKVSETQLKLVNLVATSQTSTIEAVINNLGVNSHKAIFGEVKAEISQVTNGFVAKDEADNVVAAFKIKNTGDEDLKLKYLVINTPSDGLSYSLGYSNLKIYDRAKQKKVGQTIGKPVAGANKIGLGSYTIKVGEEIIFDVHIKTNTQVTDREIEIYFSGLEAVGKTSKVSANIAGDPTAGYKFAMVTGTSDKPNNHDSDNQTITFIKPVSGSITYGFHDPDYPYRDQFEHTGIDIETAQGTKVKAAAAGEVMEVVTGDLNTASYVVIKHSNGLSTKYAHLSRIDVKVGDTVKQGDYIGLSGGKPGTIGAGPYTNGPHLHFEVLENGVAVDPEKYL